MTNRRYALYLAAVAMVMLAVAVWALTRTGPMVVSTGGL
jgi:hypothetical protein